MPADHDPMQPVGGSPLATAAPIGPQEIVAHLREAAGSPPGQQSPWEHLVWWFAADAIEALTAKNQRLTDALNTSVLEACEEIDDRLKPEIERLTDRLANAADGMGYWRRIAQRFRELLVDENAVDAVSREDWYAAERHHFEAAHAAAVQAKRQAERAEDDDALSAVAMRDLVDAAGIDMDLLGELCREEPDADTKREVDAMMDDVRAAADKGWSDEAI